MSLFDQRPNGGQPLRAQGARPDRSRGRGGAGQQRGPAGPAAGQQQQMVDLTARLALTLAREQAELAPAVLQTWEIGTEANIATSGLEAGRAYNEEAQDLNQRAKAGEAVDTAQLGSPHLKVWTEVCAYLGKTLEEGASKQHVEQYYRDKVLNAAPEALGDSVPVFRVRRNKGKDGNGKDKCRFQFTFNANDHQIATVLVNQLKKEGATRRVGSAPRGALERELGRLVNG
ncbi:unnamed protein product [Prorocentrum cordatum]|uniref:Uncharacterized protein n=1 Tax=Prorocentrum cordatum TaxID=2364126 RepID=A0ABN9UMG5_9DINO|nr:unnamed protein product [Polarella glacialis]